MQEGKDQVYVMMTPHEGDFEVSKAKGSTAMSQGLSPLQYLPRFVLCTSRIPAICDYTYPARNASILSDLLSCAFKEQLVKIKFLIRHGIFTNQNSQGWQAPKSRTLLP